MELELGAERRRREVSEENSQKLQLQLEVVELKLDESNQNQNQMKDLIEKLKNKLKNFQEKTVKIMNNTEFTYEFR